jgi:cell division protein FtsQ
MKLYQSFLDALDAGKEKISDKLSEVDLSSPEDIKALIPSGNADILVHFGDDDFLARYLRFEQRLPEWKQQYPKLASADMRYEREVVLEMAPGNAVPVSAEEKAKTAAAAGIAAKGILGGKPIAKPAAAKAKLTPKPVIKAKAPVAAHPAAKPAPKAYVTPMHIHTPQQAGPQ